MSIEVSFQGTAVGRRENRHWLLWVDTGQTIWRFACRAAFVRGEPPETGFSGKPALGKHWVSANCSVQAVVLGYKWQRNAVARLGGSTSTSRAGDGKPEACNE